MVFSWWGGYKLGTNIWTDLAIFGGGVSLLVISPSRNPFIEEILLQISFTPGPFEWRIAFLIILF